MTHATQLGLMNTVPQMDIPLYSTEFLSKDGIHFVVRPIQPDDERLMVDFHKRLSEQTVYLRYFGPLRYDVRIGHERLSKLCSIDFKKQIALVAICKDANGNPQLAAIARLIRTEDMRSAEIAFLVADKQQHHGLGTYLLQRIIELARREGLQTLEAIILTENLDMKDMLRRAGFKFGLPDMNSLTARLDLFAGTVDQFSSINKTH